MKRLFSEKGKFIFLSSLLFVVVITISIFLAPFGEVGITLLLLLTFVGIIGLSTGVVFALSVSLVLFFVVGSVLFWIVFSGVELFDDYLPLLGILAWMVAQFSVAILSGTLSSILNSRLVEVENLRKEIKEIVAVDSTTGFDNINRFLLELEGEFHRSKQYGRTFTVLVIKINHFNQFRKLYGEEEKKYLVKYIAMQLHKLTRITDNKFRLDDERFALILTDTSVDKIDKITKRLNQEMTVFRLKNNKFVNLTFEYGFVEYDKDIKTYLDIYEMALEQVSINA